ncbi:hypothetical protein [Natronococcus roseus]|uniref:hypothetical protein n=1 Tax=Natronococcus roseus TaxID=1052014 RepID=UPI00374DCB0F
MGEFSELLENRIHYGRLLFGLTFDESGETLVLGAQYNIAVRALVFRDTGPLL